VKRPAVHDIDLPAGRFRLRPMREPDAADLRRIVTIPSVGRMLFLFPAVWTESEAADFIARCAFRGALPFRLAIAGAGDRMVGSVGVDDGPAPEVFYFLDPAEAGGGAMTAAMRAFVGFLFGRFTLEGLTARVFTDNPASARVLEKLGFVRTGEATAVSAQRLEPAPVWQYRLRREAFRA